MPLFLINKVRLNYISHYGNITKKTFMNYENEKEIKSLQEELKRSENTCRLLDEENLKLIKKNEELMIKIKELEEMLQPYKDEVQKLIDENNKLKEKAFVPRAQEITDKQIQEIKELRADGLSYRAIEKETGWSKFTIGRVLKGEYDK